jgi:CHASE2 domain-containing sensor protein
MWHFGVAMQEHKQPFSLTRLIFKFDNLMIMIGTVLMVSALYVIPQNVDFLDPVGNALGDIDLTDMVFSQFRGEEQSTVDTNIVLVNIGQANREEIAQILDHVNAFEPLVVGMDAFFWQPKDSASDEHLRSAFATTTNLVMVSKVAFTEEYDDDSTTEGNGSNAFDTLVTSHPMFMEGAQTGFANFVIDEDNDYLMCRETALRDSCAGRIEPSFALRMAMIADPAAAKVAMARPLGPETINYHGNAGAFYYIDLDQALDAEMDLSIVQGKVVLLGYMGTIPGEVSLVDRWFTPLNPRYVGRSIPDMYGVVVHANVLSMIMRGNYIGSMSTWWSIAFGLVLLFVNVTMFTYIYERFESWYDVLAVTIQLFESIALLFLVVYVFDRMQYKLAFTPALFGVFLFGTVHDLYHDSIKKLLLEAAARWKRRQESASSHARKRTSAPPTLKGG